jgi:transposase
MNSHLLGKPERFFVEEARANTRDKVAYMKLSVLVLLDEGLTQEMTATLLGISLGTVNKCKQKYEDDGLDKYLDKHYVPYSGKLTDEQLAMLEDQVTNGMYSTCSQINDWIENNFGFRYSESALRSILHKLDFSYKKTTSVPGGLDSVEQAAFLTQLEPFLAETDPETEVVCFIDAVHPQHNTRSDYVWTKRGQKKEVPSNTGRSRLNINGAMNAHAPEEVTVVESECINAQSTQNLLEKLLARYEDKETIWVIADNARYYDNTTLREWLSKNPKIQILHLPPYSPNLNLIERLWKFMRKKVINLHYYRKFDDFRRAILDFFQNIDQYKWDLESLITPNFQRFSALPGIR